MRLRYHSVVSRSDLDMKTIDEHIQKDQEEFLKALAEHNEGMVLHLTE